MKQPDEKAARSSGRTKTENRPLSFAELRERSPIRVHPETLQSEAEMMGHKPLAGPYSSGEEWMLRNTLRDLAGCRDAVLARLPVGYVIFRQSRALKEV